MILAIKTQEERQLNYRELFAYHVDGQLVSDIRDSINNGIGIDCTSFKEQVETLTDRRIQPNKQGCSFGCRKE